MFGPQLSQWYILLEWGLCMMMVRIKRMASLSIVANRERVEGWGLRGGEKGDSGQVGEERGWGLAGEGERR